MGRKLLVLIPEREAVEYPLEDGHHAIGSAPSCEIQIDYQGEVANQAASLEVRGEAVFIRNLNEFSVYRWKPRIDAVR